MKELVFVYALHICVYIKYSFVLFCWHVVFFHYVWFPYTTHFILWVHFSVSDHFTFMNLKLWIKGSKKIEICIGTIFDLPFLCMKMAYSRKCLSCRLRNLKPAIIFQELELRSNKVTLKKLTIFAHSTTCYLKCCNVIWVCINTWKTYLSSHVFSNPSWHMGISVTR